MLTDKQQKKEFKEMASKNPDQFYPITALKKEGFNRNKCSCGKYFWHVDNSRKTCGDASCIGGFDISEGSPAKNKLTYVQVWEKIKECLPKYQPINRYPVVARWNPTTEYVIASIAAFQPYVITGLVEPPAKKLVIPQFSLRFSDIDNVGVTGSHCTGFVMIGQHAFLDEKEWNQEELFLDIYNFLMDGVGLIKEELTIHEDAWAGGGSFGPCMEFFSRGIELFNQVYTMFEQTEKGSRPLKLKVLDMGLGMERVAWFTQGTSNMYEATFPYVLKKLREKTEVKIDHALYKKFSKYSALLNVDEVDDINLAWNGVAKKLDISVKELREKIWPNVALYSIAEHARTLLVALNDGALPSNVGGGYNLRSIMRRSLSFIDEFDWNVSFIDIMKWHAHELKPIFPELSEKIEEINRIINNEISKYKATKEKAKLVLKKYLGRKITDKDLLELYDSHGISPDVVKETAKTLGQNIDVPDDFYSKVVQLHEKKEQVHTTKKKVPIETSEMDDTTSLYYDDYLLVEFTGKVIYVQEDYVILDKTCFYPTSGGQLHDVGTINDLEVKEVIKQDNVIVHLVKGNTLKIGDEVKGIIDKDRRKQLSQLHTSTHIVNAAARQVLGTHINQAGAKKVLEKAHLDITHYMALSNQETKKIENIANEIVEKKITIKKSFMTRSDAEKKYGMSIYQGGAVPGNKLRIVDIKGIDVEACGGTHLNNTSEVGHITITKTTKISDGIVRIEFVSGGAESKIIGKSQDIIDEIIKLLEVEKNQIPSRVDELFNLWKKTKKAIKKKNELPKFILESAEEFGGDVLEESAKILKTQAEHIPKIIKRFLEEINEMNKKSN